jgi:tetratricopeptide (TPR) repeat protein
LAIEQLNSEQPLISRAAIDVLRNLPPNQGYQYLYPMLKDPVKSVRFHATSLLASWLSQMPDTLLPELAFALNEYKTSLLRTADFPTSQLSLAQLGLATGDTRSAQKHFKQALTIAPNLPVAMLSLADFWRQTNNQTKELALLEKPWFYILILPTYYINMVRIEYVKKNIIKLKYGWSKSVN